MLWTNFNKLALLFVSLFRGTFDEVSTGLIPEISINTVVWRLEKVTLYPLETLSQFPSRCEGPRAYNSPVRNILHPLAHYTQHSTSQVGSHCHLAGHRPVTESLPSGHVPPPDTCSMNSSLVKIHRYTNGQTQPGIKLHTLGQWCSCHGMYREEVTKTNHMNGYLLFKQDSTI